MEKVCTIQARATEKIVNLAATYGIRPQKLYQATQLKPARLSDPDHRIPFAQLVALYETAARLTGDDLFGLRLGESVDPGAFDVLGYAATNSPTLGGALDRVVRYHSIWTDGAVFDIDRRRATATIKYSYLDRTIGESRQDSEMTMAAVVGLGRQVTNSDWSPLETRFPHPAPRDTAEHTRIFRSPVRFDSGSCQLVFAAATLNLPIAKADQGLLAVLDRHAEELLARYPRRDVLVDLVRRVIRDELNGGNPSLERVAAQTGFGPRTLQRRLREQGTSHQDLLDQMRRDLAMKYLTEPQIAVCEVAYLLGFSESSALHRAFKRWTGMTPSEFRVR